MIEIDTENPWILGGLLIGIWILVGVGVETILFEGEVLRAAMWGAFGGIGFTIVLLYFRKRQAE